MSCEGAPINWFKPSSHFFFLTVPRWYFFVDYLCYLCLMFVMFLRLSVAALWSPEWKGLIAWLLFVMFFVILLLSHLALSDFINLTQVHNFTVSAQDIFTFRRLSAFTVSFTGTLQLLMQIMKRFVPSYWLVKWLWYRVYNHKVVSSSPCVCVFFTFIRFVYFFYRCTTTSEEWNFGSFNFKRLMRNA